MPVCPACAAEVSEEAPRCPACGAARGAPGAGDPVSPPDETWVTVYTGRGMVLGLVEEDLLRRGVPVARADDRILGATLELGVLSPESSFYRLTVPAEVYEAQREAIDAAVALGDGGSAADPSAMAEAEEDYDIRGCPQCERYFHNPRHTEERRCPGCGAQLLPAVDCLPEGAAGPERVIVASGAEAEMRALAARFDEAGFGATVTVPAGWSVAVTEIEWLQLNDRTAEARQVLDAGRTT